MAPPLRSTTRQRVLAILAAGATAASSAALLAPGTSTASSHREAPYTLSDPQADNTDTYAFVSPDNPDTVTLTANFQGFQEPAQGPNFYPWDDKARYEIHIDNNGDAKPDITYRWQFKDIDQRGTAERGAQDGTFLLNDGPVNSFDDPTLKFKQTYDLQGIRYNADGTEQAPIQLVTGGKAAPPNVGRASTPKYADLRAEAITPTQGPAAGGKAFAGPSDDPFFLDLRIFDLLYGADLSETGFDGLSGYNVNTVALQVPKRLVVANNDPAKNPVIGVWSTTSRQKSRVLLDTNAPSATSVNQDSDTVQPSGNYVQVSRLGNPLVNEAVVPANLKDFFNRTTPDKDAAFLPKVQDPEVPILVEQIYKIPNPNKLAGQTNDDKRNDLVAAFLTGFSRDVFAGRTFGGAGAGVLDADLNSLDINEVSPNPVPAEYLRLNVNVAPKKPGDRGFSRLGAVGGDLAGFPNGRRLQDDVVDIALQVLEGVLVRPAGATKAAVAGLGDGVHRSDVALSGTFPYVGLPHAGSTPRRGQDPVQFRQQFLPGKKAGQVVARVYGISPGAKGGTAQLIGIKGNGQLVTEAYAKINASGTATSTVTLTKPAGRQLTLFWRIIPVRTAAGGANSGPPTTFTVR
nr:DUF4331 domain-containing protein [uncultured Friedmanniella sp.]